MIKWHIKAVANEEPLGAWLVDVNVGRLIGWWQDGIGIGCVNFDAKAPFMRA